MFWKISSRFSDGSVSVEVVASVHRAKAAAESKLQQTFCLQWGILGRLVLEGEGGQQIIYPCDLVLRKLVNGESMVGESAIEFLKIYERFPSAFQQVSSVVSPYIGNKYPLE